MFLKDRGIPFETKRSCQPSLSISKNKGAQLQFVVDKPENCAMSEKAGTSHTLTVAVSDSDLIADATITITVVDVDENNAPVIAAQTFSIAEDLVANGTVAEVSGY